MSHKLSLPRKKESLQTKNYFRREKYYILDTLTKNEAINKGK